MNRLTSSALGTLLRLGTWPDRPFRGGGRCRGHPLRGFTAVELMMGLSIFAVGVTGVVSMQVISARSNIHARDLAVATQIARSWQDRLSIDGMTWGGPSRWLLNNTSWLQQVGANNNAWILPATVGGFGPAFDVRGSHVNEGVTTPYFCTHIRLTQLMNREGLGLIRSEVRVFWPKGRTAWASGGNTNYCQSGSAVISVGAATDNFHFVYQTSAVRETPVF